MKNHDKERFKSAIHYLNKVSIDGTIDDEPFSLIEEDFDEHWAEITENPEIHIYFKYSEDDSHRNLTISQLIDATELLKYGVLDYERGMAKSNSVILFHIDAPAYEDLKLIKNLVEYNESIVSSSKHHGKCLWKQTIKINGTQVSISVLTGTITFYNLLLEKEKKLFEHFPVYHDELCFICVEFEGDITLGCAELLAAAFLFELNTTLGIHFTRNFSTENDLDDWYEKTFGGYNSEKEEHKKYNSRDYSIKQILHGKGMHDVIKIFNAATNTDDYNYKILCFSRIIEFIAPTVARKELINNVLSKLAENNENEPNADLVMELGGMYRKFDTIKDKALCRITILSIINLSEIKKWVTDPMRNWKDIDNSDKNEEILKRIADSITATRNEIAHAKSTYARTGLECPEEHKGDFAIMMQKIAEHLIRWFDSQPIEMRVIGS